MKPLHATSRRIRGYRTATRSDRAKKLRLAAYVPSSDHGTLWRAPSKATIRRALARWRVFRDTITLEGFAEYIAEYIKAGLPQAMRREPLPPLYSAYHGLASGYIDAIMGEIGQGRGVAFRVVDIRQLERTVSEAENRLADAISRMMEAKTC